jgi:hypothetical protein
MRTRIPACLAVVTLLAICTAGAGETVSAAKARPANWAAPKEMTGGGFGFHEVWANLRPWVKELDIDEIKRKAGLTAEQPGQ